MRRAPLLLLLLLFAAPVRAHQAPSPDANNRYLKVTLLPDRARLSFTLLFGDRPAAIERGVTDVDRDGRISPAEARILGERVRESLAPLVRAGGAAPRWTVADVSIGDDARARGPFAVDLTMDAPWPDPRAAEQRLELDDAAAVPLAGESELRVEESPGVRVVESHLASATAGVELVYLFTGNAAAPGERRVVVRAVVEEALRPAPRTAWLPLAAVLVGLAAGAAVLARRKRVSGTEVRR